MDRDEEYEALAEKVKAGFRFGCGVDERLQRSVEGFERLIEAAREARESLLRDRL